MTPNQARDFQAKVEKIAYRMLAGHMEAEDMIVLARISAEILSHIAAREEARMRVPNVSAHRRKDKEVEE